jgi:glycosyltransferase involved in cell wall biosynthesis
MKKERATISVTIIAGDEEKNIVDCLESAAWADEIVLVDSESTDNTVQLARRYTDKIFIQPWLGFAKQKQFALDKASCDWVLSLDADERATPELAAEIKELLKKGTEYDGFYIPRKSYLWNKWIKSCGWYPGYQLRLFRNGKAKLTDRKVHEGFVVDGEAGYLKKDMIHYTHQNLRDTFKKINEYSSLAAEEKSKRGKVGVFGIMLHASAAFLNHFIVKRGFTDGAYGFMVSAMHTITNLLTYMKIWEIQHIGTDKPE